MSELWTQDEIEKRILATLKMPVHRAMEMREVLEQCWQRGERIRDLEDGLRHIRDHHYSAEMCREIASATLDGRDDYQEPPR